MDRSKVSAYQFLAGLLLLELVLAGITWGTGNSLLFSVLFWLGANAAVAGAFLVATALKD